MKKFIILLVFVCLNLISFAQMNDTIYYKSGMVKVVEITAQTEKQLKYETISSKGEKVNSQVMMGTVKRYVIYDSEGILQYDSKQEDERLNNERMNYKYPDSSTVRTHLLSINPFILPLASLNLKYTYTFGDKMQYSFITRGTFLSPVLFGDDSDFLFVLGAGLKFTPFYNHKFSFGVDIAPSFALAKFGGIEPFLLLPVNFDLDFYLTQQFGIAVDFGTGTAFQPGTMQFLVRGHFGIFWQFGKVNSFGTNYN